MLDKGEALWYNKKAVRRADGEKVLRKKLKKLFKNLLTSPRRCGIIGGSRRGVDSEERLRSIIDN